LAFVETQGLSKRSQPPFDGHERSAFFNKTSAKLALRNGELGDAGVYNFVERGEIGLRKRQRVKETAAGGCVFGLQSDSAFSAPKKLKFVSIQR
jgi:hypothetical protein